MIEKNIESIIAGNNHDPEDTSVALELINLRKFETEVVTFFAAAKICATGLEKKPGDESLSRDLEKAKNNFYSALENISRGDPVMVIRGVSLSEFKDFENLDWSKQEVLEKIDGLMRQLFNLI
jgi:hypothetical protein